MHAPAHADNPHTLNVVKLTRELSPWTALVCGQVTEMQYLASESAAGSWGFMAPHVPTTTALKTRIGDFVVTGVLGVRGGGQSGPWQGPSFSARQHTLQKGHICMVTNSSVHARQTALYLRHSLIPAAVPPHGTLQPFLEDMP